MLTLETFMYFSRFRRAKNPQIFLETLNLQFVVFFFKTDRKDEKSLDMVVGSLEIFNSPYFWLCS